MHWFLTDQATIWFQAWKDQALNIQISKLHQDVSTVLSSLGIDHRNEFLTEDEYYSIDIAVLEGVLGPYRVALEVDGPFHFASNTRAPLGRQLQSSQHLILCLTDQASLLHRLLSAAIFN